MKANFAAVHLNANDPVGASEQVGMAVSMMAHQFLEAVGPAKADTDGALFMGCVLGAVVGICCAEMGPDAVFALMRRMETDMAATEGARAH